MRLSFKQDRAYVLVADHKFLTWEDYMAQPLIYWLHHRVGAMKWPRLSSEMLQGQGWHVDSDWSRFLTTGQEPEVWVVFDPPLDDQRLTEFWMRFQ